MRTPTTTILAADEQAPRRRASEVTNVLRRLVVKKILTEKQGTAALNGFSLLVLSARHQLPDRTALITTRADQPCNARPIARLTSVSADVDRLAALVEAGIVRPASAVRRQLPSRRVKLTPGESLDVLVAQQRR